VLGAFASTVSGDIDKINAEFDKNYSQIIARGTTIDNLIGMLFAAYQVIPCFNFRTYINRMHKDYLDGKHPTMTHETLMGMTKSKFNYLHNKGTWGAKSLNNNKFIVMTATINELKGQLKLLPQLAAVAAKGDKGKQKKKVQKTKNKQNTSDQVKQKKDEAWKKIPPKEGEKHKKEHDGRTYYWCVHHMVWTMHTPKKFCLRKERKREKVANLATITAAAVIAVNPSYQALLLTLAKFQDEEE
jgi:hypothetical protein